MKNKIYIVHQSVEILGDVQQRMVRAFACRRTAKKFIDYKNIKLAELKNRFGGWEMPISTEKYSKTHEAKLKRFLEVYSTNEYFLKEVDLHY